MVPKEEIRRITLSHDSMSRHPFLQFLAGFVLTVTGLILGIAAFILADEGGVFLVEVKPLVVKVPIIAMGLCLLIWLGLWLLKGVFRGRYNFLIDTEKGTRKVFFEEPADIQEIAQFVRRAQQELGYHIDVSIMESMHF